MTTLGLEKKIIELQQELNRMTAEKKQVHKRFYTNKYKIVEGMTEEEKAVIQKNIDHRNQLARERYRKNKATREKQKTRARERYRRLKEESENNNKSNNTSSADLSSHPDKA